MLPSKALKSGGVGGEEGEGVGRCKEQGMLRELGGWQGGGRVKEQEPERGIRRRIAGSRARQLRRGSSCQPGELRAQAWVEDGVFIHEEGGGENPL